MEPFDEPAAAALIERVTAGDRAAWPPLMAQLFPVLEHIARRSHSMGPLRGSADHCRNVATETCAKLERNEFRALVLVAHWREANPGKTLLDWLRIVTTNVARGYVERQLGARRSDDQDAGAKRRALHSLATALPTDGLDGLRPPVTDQQTTRAILEYATEHLPADQLVALRAWLEQASFAEIAVAAGRTEARDGEKLVRAALARLRREFAIDTGNA